MLTRTLLTIAVVALAVNCGKDKKKSATHGSDPAGDGGSPQTQDDSGDAPPTDPVISPPQNSGKSVLVEKLDMTKIASLGLRKGSSGLGLTGENDTLLVSLDESGNASPLSLVENGEETKFAGIVPVGSEFVYFILDYYSVNIQTAEGELCPTVVLKKTDGKLFCIPDVSLNGTYTGRSFENDFITDRSGKLHYFEGGPYKESTFSGYPYIYAVDFRSGDTPKVSIRYNKVGYPEQRAVNYSGDLLFRFYEEIGDRQMRIAQNDGGFQPAGWRSYVSCIASGEGSDREAFFFTEGDAMGKLARNSAGIYEESYIYPINSVGGQDNADLKNFRCDAVTSDQDSIYWAGEVATYVNNQYVYDAYLLTQEHETNLLNRTAVPGIKSLQQVSARKSSIVILGLSDDNKVVIRAVDKATKAVSTLFEVDAPLSANDAHNFQGSMAVQENSLTLSYYLHSKNGYETVIVGSGADNASEQHLINFISIK